MNSWRNVLFRLKRFLWIGFVAALMLSGDSVWGRAGGGGGYSGGGGGGFSGGGSYGRGGGGARLFHFRSSTDGTVQVENIVYTIVVMTLVVISIVGQIRDRGLADDRDDGDGPLIHSGDHQVRLVELTRVDPAFDWERFAARFGVGFLAIQNAWQYHQLDKVRHFVSDGVLERFTLQLQEQRDKGYRDHMEAIQIRHLALGGFRIGDVFETITIQVHASAIDYRVGYETGDYVSGDKKPDTFIEFWSFVRRRGVSTREAGGLMEGECPNCSAPISLTQNGHCSSCDAVVRSGEYDWVLSEITQACEWRASAAGEDRDAAVRNLRAHDPGLSVQHLEDRASVIFWRQMMAERLATIRPLQKVATPDYLKGFEADRLSLNSDGWRSVYSDCSVGAVDLCGTFSDESYDYALLMVKWAARLEYVNEARDRTRPGRWGRRKSLFVLYRNRGVTTRLKTTLESAHCPNCAAPESDVASDQCGYCGEVLNTGQFDWILLDAQLHASARARNWMSRLSEANETSESSVAPASPQMDGNLSPLDLLANMISVLAADGEVLPNEKAALLSFAHKNSIAEAMVDGLIDAAVGGELEAQLPEDPAAGRQWIQELADMALVDGRVDQREKEVLTKVGSKYGLVFADIQIILGKRLAHLNRREETAEVAVS